MLSDRPYMRQNYQRSPGTSVLTWLLCGLGAAYLIQLALQWAGNQAMINLLALRPQVLAVGKFWTLFSYPLLNEHLLIALANGLGIYIAGREILPLIGPRRFCGLVLGTVLLGALAWLGIQATHDNEATLMGATAITVGMFVVFALAYPEKEIEFLLFFVLPLRMRPRMVIWTLLCFELIGLSLGEIAGGRFDTHIAHSAHLGGMIAGWLFFRYFHARQGMDRADDAPLLQLPGWLKRDKRQEAPKYKVNVTPPVDLKSEVDRILDKINSSGFASLTDDEKRLLDEAKDMLSRH
jgi:membrane associated rhomboid family serine protease